MRAFLSTKGQFSVWGRGWDGFGGMVPRILVRFSLDASSTTRLLYLIQNVVLPFVAKCGLSISMNFRFPRLLQTLKSRLSIKSSELPDRVRPVEQSTATDSVRDEHGRESLASLFDSSFYLGQNPHLVASGANPLHQRIGFTNGS